MPDLKDNKDKAAGSNLEISYNKLANASMSPPRVDKPFFDKKNEGLSKIECNNRKKKNMTSRKGGMKNKLSQSAKKIKIVKELERKNNSIKLIVQAELVN